MKKFWVILLSVVGVLLVLFLAAGWYFSGLIIDGATIKGQTRDYTNTVTAVDGKTISYTVDDEGIEDVADDDFTRSLTGMSFPNGTYVQLADDATVDGRTVTRTYTLLEGPKPTVGEKGMVDWNAYPDAESMGLKSHTITYDSPLGPMPAIVVDPSAPATGTWAVVAHGRNASRREGLRITPLLAERGMTTILINYRDDAQEPDVPKEDGIGNFGYTEWEDLQAAVDYATSNGAEQVLLVGYSMGGAVIGGYVENGDNTDAVVGTILHSPAVNFSDVVTFGAEQMGIPTGPAAPLIWVAEQMTQLRANIDFGAVNYINEAPNWPVPALVTATKYDDLVPPSSIEEFATDAPDAEYVFFPDASHTGEWNSDRKLYDQTVEAWLDAQPQLK